MAVDPRSLIEKLVALALNNPNAEEAGRAAIKALHLMRKYHGHIVLRAAPMQTPPDARPGPAPARTNAPPPPWGSQWTAAERRARDASARDYAQNARGFGSWMGEPPPSRSAQEVHDQEARHYDDLRRMAYALGITDEELQRLYSSARAEHDPSQWP